MATRRIPPTPDGCDKKLWRSLTGGALARFDDALSESELSMIESVCRADAHARRTAEASREAALFDETEQGTKPHPAHALAVAAATSLRHHHRAYRQMLDTRKVPEGKGQVGKRKTGARTGVSQPAKGKGAPVSWLDEVRDRSSKAG